mmetsp:Transcript_22202/g.28507  ORF Transcript_22202/g.28507 Transcript_22202/m.28507 type:complete len:120 (+) Transcript_22202:239-598(+)
MPYCCQTRHKESEDEYECDFVEKFEESLFSERSSTQEYQIDINDSLRNQVITNNFALNVWEERARHLLRSSALLSCINPIPVDLAAQNPIKPGLNNRTITTTLEVSNKATCHDGDADIV